MILTPYIVKTTARRTEVLSVELTPGREKGKPKNCSHSCIALGPFQHSEFPWIDQSEVPRDIILKLDLLSRESLPPSPKLHTYPDQKIQKCHVYKSVKSRLLSSELMFYTFGNKISPTFWGYNYPEKDYHLTLKHDFLKYHKDTLSIFILIVVMAYGVTYILKCFYDSA